MKLKKRYVFLGLIACIYTSNKVCFEGLENSVALLVENGFYLPKESCLCMFRKTVANRGSGEGWIYGEDNKYYYTIDDVAEHMTENKFNISSDYIPSYYILKKGENSEILEKLDYAAIINKELDAVTPIKMSQEEIYHNAERIREVFRNHGKSVKCRAERSRWLGGC